MKAVRVIILFAAGFAAARETVEFSFGWKFFEGEPGYGECPKDAFPLNRTGVECMGLQFNSANTADSCRDACCFSPSCLVWQFEDPNTKGGGCWIGNPESCTNPNSNWVGGGRTSGPSSFPAANKTFPDSDWEVVDAPHDFLISGEFSSSNKETDAYLPRNVSFYRKHFTIPTDRNRQSIWAQFDGVFHIAQGWLNSEPVGIHENGYTTFAWRLDNVSTVEYGSESVLALFVDATETSSWWFAGGGIYRHVRLIATERLHIAFDGLYMFPNVTGTITPNGASPSAGLTSSAGVILASAEVALDEGSSETATVKFDVIDDATGATVASKVSKSISVSTAQTVTATASIDVSNVQLWSTPRPYTYTVRATVFDSSSNAVDITNTSIGFRIVDFDANKGFFLNGFHLQHRGFCDHNNFEGVGMALSDRIHLFQAQSIRSIGGNARRTSHNAPDPQTMAVEDALGIMVLDENRNFLDANTSFQAWHDLVKRDRNHPSNVFWSECNEAGCYFPGSSIPDVASRYRTIAKALDPYRAITQNGFPGKLEPALPYLDLQGLSHRNPSDYMALHKEHPDVPLVGSECCSCENTRGEDSAANGEPYSNNPASCVADQTNWVLNVSETGINIVGTYTWTAFDYYGEGHDWPQKSCSYGQFDLSGFPKAAAHFYRDWWLLARPDSDAGRVPVIAKPEVHIVESWDAGESSSRTMNVYGGGVSSIEFFVNGASQGKQSIGAYEFASWSVTWATGNVQAVGYDASGNKVATHTVYTTSEAKSIQLSLDAPSPHSGTGDKLLSDGFDTALLRASLLDANGQVAHNASNNITFSIISGPGRIVGTGNGNPIDVNPVQVPWRIAFHGLARCIIRSTQDSSSPLAHRKRMLEIDSQHTVSVPLRQEDAATSIVVQASADGLPSVQFTIPLSSDPATDGVVAVARANAVNVSLDLI